VEGPPPTAPPTMVLRSQAFSQNQAIPQEFTCDGKGVSPPLRWSAPVGGTRSVALLVEDPDAPDGTFVHWTAWGIPGNIVALPAGAKPAHEGANSKGDTGWTPPCPPGGKPHRYVFTVYDLRAPLTLEDGAKPDEVRAAISKEALAKGTLIGTFGR
jgi:Raf kinase inhibitor-like YbhB/YbcL family protein